MIVLGILARHACSAKDKADANIHGPLEFLQHSLLQSADEFRLLAAAKRQLTDGDEDLAFRALLEIFAQPYDSFTPIIQDRSNSGTYQTALSLIRAADYRTRAEWSVATEPLASEELDRAMESGNDAALRAVSRRFPYTQSGMKSLAARAVLAATHGRTELAASIVSELESIYGSSQMSFDAANTIRALRQQIPGDTTISKSTTAFAGDLITRVPQRLSLPWNQTLWKWSESVWRHPEAAAAIAGLSLPENRSLLALNSWQPVLLTDRILFRSPVQILAFDKLTGRKLWTLATDTKHEDRGITENEPLYYSTRISVPDLLQMNDLGSMTVSGGSLYFIDHFRKLVHRESAQRRGILGLGQGMDIDSLPTDPAVNGGTRLVAVRLGDKPTIAWTTGGGDEFNYRFDVAGRMHSEKAIARDVFESAESSFASQYFLGVPLAHDKMLFVLSADEEMIWLSCLTESTGRLLWRRPLLYQGEPDQRRRGRYQSLHDVPAGASICGVDGDVLISALRSGIIVGTRILTGDLEWAVNLRDDPAADEEFAIRSYAGARYSQIGPQFQPVTSNGRLIWAVPECSHIHCMDTKTGSVLWRTARILEGNGTLEGSHDSYAVAVTRDSVVLTGTRHVRALRLSDGEQLWVTTVQRQSGRAVCHGNHCLVPQQDGSVVSIDVTTGQKGITAGDIFEKTDEFSGSLIADDDVVCSATPLSLVVRPTASLISNSADVAGDSPGDIESAQLRSGQLELLNGNAAAGIQKLQAVILNSESPEIRQTAIRLLGNLLLHDIAENRFEKRGAASPLSTAVDEMLRELPLTGEEKIRRQVLSSHLIGDTKQLDGDQIPLLNILPDWQVRADVAAWSLGSAATASQLAPLESSTRDLFDRIELATLFPEQLGTTAEQTKFARDLIEARHFAAAEMLILSALQTDSADSAELKAVLNGLRSSASRVRAPVAATNESTAERLLSDIQLEVEESTSLDSRIGEILAAAKSIVDVPEWYRDRVFLVNRNLFTVNPESGGVSIPYKLPASLSTVFRDSDDRTPGIVPVVQSNHIGVLSLLSPSGPQLLWWKQLSREISDLSVVEVGPVTPGVLIAGTASRVYGLHPLTGKTLWQRDLTLGLPSADTFQRTERLIGDSRVFGVLGQHLQTCEVFRTIDGRRQGVVKLDIPSGQIPLISGRRVLFVKDNVLVLKDLLSGENVLSSRPNVRVEANGQSRLLGNGRAVIITDELKALVLNLHSGQEELRCELAPHLDRQRLTGLNAFERDGRLFVLIKDWGDPGNELSATSRIGDQRIDSGTMFCIDPKTGELIWHIAAVPSVMPIVYGDPTDFLVTWSWHVPASNLWQRRRIGGIPGDSSDAFDDERMLIVRLLDGRTGQTLAEHKGFCPREPLRCWNDARSETITIETEKSTIKIRYGGSR